MNTVFRHRALLFSLMVYVLCSPSAVADTFADTFSSVAYDRQDGDQNWFSDWAETGELIGVPWGGDVEIVGGRVHLQADNNSIRRSADLSAYTTAILSFDYEVVGFEVGDELYLEVRAGASGAWIIIDTFTSARSGTGSISYDISAYINALTGIRFRTGALSAFDDFYFDNILIDATVAAPSGCVTFRDEFSTEAYNRQDGTANWTSSWDEVGDNDNPSNGDIEINAGELVLEGDGGGSPYIQREADLSAYSSATLRFNYRETGDWESSDDIHIDVSSDGGVSWSRINTFNNDQGSVSQLFSQDISGYIASNFRVRFVEEADSGAELFFFDNVEIEACGVAVTLPAAAAEYWFDEASWGGVPGEVVDSSANGNDGIALETAAGVQTISDGFICRAGRFPDTASNASYAVNTGLLVDADGSNNGAISFWYRSNSDWTSTGATKMLWDASTTDKYFYLSLRPDGRLSFGLEDSSDNDYRIITANPQTYAADEWVHVVVNWDTDLAALSTIWVNGAQQLTTEVENTLNGLSVLSATETLYVGDNRGSYFIDNSSNRSADGDIDEVLVFDAVLAAAAIAQINSLQSAGLNLDGSARSCATEPLVFYRFEEASWDGSANEVLDSGPSSLHGTAINGTNTNYTGPVPAIDGDPGTCRYGDFTGGTDHLRIPDNNVFDLPNELTVALWIYPRSFPASGLNTILSKDTNYEFHLNSSRQINWWWNDSVGNTREFNTSGTPLNPDTWYHVAIVYTSGAQQIYINGVQQGSASFTGALATNTEDLYIGTDTGFIGSRNFNGAIDEVRIYDTALTQAEVAAVRDITYPCTLTAAVANYRIAHTGTGITCTPADVSFTAYDAGGNIVVPPAGTAMRLSTSTNVGVWSGTGLSSPGAGSAVHSWNGTDSSVTLSLAHPLVASAPDVDIDINAATTDPQEDPAFDAALDFVEAGFLFSAMPNQVSGRDSAALSVQAIRTDNTTGECVGIFASGSTVSVEMRATCENPTTCAGRTLAVNGTPVATEDSVGVATPSYLPVAFTFGADSTAEFTLNYPDAGEMALHARYTATDANGDTLSLLGNSLPFVVVPAGLCVEAVNGSPGNPECVALDTSCEVYAKAGENFGLTVRGVTWENDSEVDSAFCSGSNLTTSNFELAAIAISPTVLAPTPASGGVNGNLTVGVASISTGGTVTYSEQIDEVGVFTFTATPPDYLGIPIAPSTSDAVGRFIPDHFELVAGSGRVDAANSNAADFTYFGQPFNVNYSLEARSALFTVTENYFGAFARLNTASHESVDSAGGENILYGALNADIVTPVSYNTSLQTSPVSSAWAAGVLDVIGLELTIDKPLAPVAPIADLDISILVEDEDDVTLLPVALNRDSDVDASNESLLIDRLPGSLVFGRVFIPPVYGTEIYLPAPDELPITVRFETQFYNGTAFERNIIDSSTTYSDWTWAVADCYDPDNTDSLDCGDTTINIPTLSGTVSEGSYDVATPITITRPGINNDGILNIEIEVDSWLQYDWGWDWDNDASTVDDVNPAFRVQFGTFRGHDRIIYWRERN